MAATLREQTSGTTSTVAHTLDAESNLVVVVAAHTETSVGIAPVHPTAVTFGGVTGEILHTESLYVGDSSQSLAVALVWAADLPAAGSHNAVVTWSGPTETVAVTVLSFADAPQSVTTARGVAGIDVVSVATDPLVEYGDSLVLTTIAARNVGDVAFPVSWGDQVSTANLGAGTAHWLRVGLFTAQEEGEVAARWRTSTDEAFPFATSVSVVFGSDPNQSVGGVSPRPTLADMREYVRGFLDLEDGDIPAAVMNVWAREGYDRIVRLSRKFPHFEKTVQFQQPANDATIVLDDHGIATIHSIRVDGFLMAPQYSVTPRHVGFGQCREYSEWDGLVLLSPTPTVPAQVELVGWREPIDWFNDQSVPDMPAQFDSVLMSYMLARGFQQLGMTQEAQLELAMFGATLDQLAREDSESSPAAPLIIGGDHHGGRRWVDLNV